MEASHGAWRLLIFILPHGPETTLTGHARFDIDDNDRQLPSSSASSVTPVPSSQPRTCVTTPNTLVFASLSNINSPSFRYSVWLMNSKTTLDRSPVRINPEGWSSDNIRTVCCSKSGVSRLKPKKENSAYPDRTAVHHRLIFRLNSAGVMENHDHSLKPLHR